MNPSDLRRQIRNRQTAARARALAASDCVKLTRLMLAGLTARELAPAFHDVADVMASAAELDGGALTTKH